jgi:cellulose synthase/poly-beta-1,6-N-acetylglucosamine synthase-like glycosyltransferase
MAMRQFSSMFYFTARVKCSRMRELDWISGPFFRVESATHASEAMTMNESLIVTGLVLQCIAAALQTWNVLHPDQPKTVGHGVVIDVAEFVSERERWFHGGSFLFFVVGFVSQVVGLFVTRPRGAVSGGSMIHFFFASGVPGCLAALVIFSILYVIACVRIKPMHATFEPRGLGSFEPILARYTRLSELVISLATGSIVLLGGSSIFRSGGKLPSTYGSPLVLLASSVVFAVLFLALCNYSYEEWQHHNNYSHHRYRLNVALGFAALIAFAVGYVWLGFGLVHN